MTVKGISRVISNTLNHGLVKTSIFGACHICSGVNCDNKIQKPYCRSDIHMRKMAFCWLGLLHDIRTL